MIPGDMGTEDSGTTLWEPLPYSMAKSLSIERLKKYYLIFLGPLIRHNLDMPKMVAGFDKYSSS